MNWDLGETAIIDGYYPFGMLMPGRTLSTEDYRFGFNGKEDLNDVKGVGKLQDFGARIYDPRLGRWLSPDKFEYMLPYLSPYNAMSNNPIFKMDSDGNIDFTYQVAKRKNEDGSMTKVVNVKVIYKVINLSDREIKQEYFQGVNNESRDYFNYKSNDVEYLKGIKDVEVNIDISFKVEKSLDNVKSGENVLLVVNELNGQKTANDPAGLATMGGNVAAVEAQYIFDPLFTSLVLHEVGHNMSLEHIGEKGNVMMPTLDNGKDLGNLNLSDQQKDNSFGRYYNINFRSDTKGSNVQGDVKSKAKDFKYDNVKK